MSSPAIPSFDPDQFMKVRQGGSTIQLSPAAQTKQFDPDAFMASRPAATSPDPSTAATEHQLENEGFLDSAWNALKSGPEAIASLFNGQFAKSMTADRARMDELRKNGTTEQRREYAKGLLLRTFPFASTVYKAAQGNIPGAAGDIVGMAPYALIPEAGGKGKNATAAEPTVKPTPSAMEMPAIAPEPGLLPEHAVASTVGKLKTRLESMPAGSTSDLQKAAAAGDTHAQQVSEQIANAGDEPSRIHQSRINLQDWRTAQEAKGLYDHIQDLVENQYKLGPVPLQATAPTISRAIAEANFGIPDKAVIGLLNDVKTALQPKPQPVPATPASAVLDPLGNPARPAAPATSVPSAPQNTYSMLRKLSDQLGERIRMSSTGDNALIGPQGIGQLQGVKSAIDQDLSAFVSKSGIPELAEAGRAADEYYKQIRVPFKDRAIANAAVTTEPDKIFDKFAKGGKDRAQKYYDALDAKGQAAVQYEIAAKAMNDAIDPVTQKFDSAKYTKSMESMKDTYGVFFQGTSKWAMDGLNNMVRHAAIVDRAPAAAIAGGTAVAAAAAHMPYVAGGAAAVAGLAKILMTTDAGRRFLYRASSLQPGTPAMSQLISGAQSVLTRMPKAAAVAGTAAALQPQQQ